MSTEGREAHRSVGFGRSNRETFTIPSGADGSAVTPVDLGRNYACIVIETESADGIAGSTTMRAEVSYDGSGTMKRLHTANAEGEWVSDTLPDTDVDFSFVLTHAFMAQRIRLILSNNASDDVTFYIYGLDQGIDNQ